MSLANGIGTAYLGQSDIMPDGSFVATKWICVMLPLIPVGSYRIWPGHSRSYLLGMYSSSTFQVARVPFHWPHLFKFYGAYLAFYLFLVGADFMSTGEWHFS